MRLHRATGCFVLLVAISQAQSYVPKLGFVPDSATAIKIAEAVLIPVYGQGKVESERPFTANLRHGIWTVAGTLHCLGTKSGVATDCSGGAAEVKLSKKDGHILKVIHYK